ncbi:hypothetical protein D6T64_11940 [Cryobacterium melibiosiphilum]|uniref:Uncharacterized protein n=1 Tax=Cryobacterium melibiosiphilum TaxID=995039 RepID=A0A3A5MRT6_9MICO|nr:hypothetical protein [Cryobacterium melibiosiphilum]RJT88094.1 hypothetical protein D6T64_11940 [Cryobacterium melibiosiphilum]
MSNTELIARLRSHSDWEDNGELLHEAADAVEFANKALDEINDRITDEAYENPSSALESIQTTLEETGREIRTGDDE